MRPRSITALTLAVTAALWAPPGLTLAHAAAHQRLAAPEDGEQDIERARELFYEGSARYSAANYTGAIDSFTQALEIVTREGAAPKVRGALLLNLGRAYVKAFDVDTDIKHLRAAREIYARYLREAPSMGYPQDGQGEARAEHDALSKRIATIEAEQKSQRASAAPPAPAAPPAASAATHQRDNRRLAGYVLTGAGAAFFLGAIGPLVYAGVALPKNTDDQIAKTMPTPEKEADFRAQESLKQNIWYGVGAGMMVLGAAGIVVGAILVVRNKKMPPAATARRLRLTPAAGRTGGGLVLSGAF